MNKYLSIITLNENWLNASIKRYTIAEWLRNHDPIICCLRDPPKNKRLTQTESEELEKKYSKKMDRKKTHGSNTHIRQNRLQKRAIKRDPEGHFIILKGRIH